MGINAMENQVYDPQQATESNVWGTVMVVGLAIVIVFAVGYGIKWAWDKFTVPAPVSAIIEKATSGEPDAGYRQYCENGKCVLVKMCTAVNAYCAASYDAKPGPQAGDIVEEVNNFDHDAAWAEVDAQMQRGEIVPIPESQSVRVSVQNANPPAGYHVSADGRVRPNPPAGWKWAGQ